GNARLGIFATRSPFRPNPLALSAVTLAGIEATREWGTVLRVRGADLADGTPILDIKPYLPYADCRPDALGGFASAAPGGEALAVECPAELWEKVPPRRREALRAVLALDTRPRYQQDPRRVYGFGFAGLEVRFSVEGNVLRVREIEKAGG
ncbi:MAG: tRNA (N6-threonylcarbamoyladenosine(37)-N6)-methyltransferase TrmO, partial [Dysosmobacter sp.]|nr:tRNA (N6-threonylcarbamoyladenosine(37)-N6)-methyltransferase TrmO [Dysosmobacter sp.]